MKLKLKDIKEIGKRAGAVDLTYLTDEEIRKYKKDEKWFNELGYSMGVYGCNGVLLQGKQTKTLYVITARTGALYCI